MRSAEPRGGTVTPASRPMACAGARAWAAPRGGAGAAGGPLDGMRVRESVADGRVAGYRLREKQPVAPRHELEPLFRSLVGVGPAHLQVQPRFPCDAEPEMSGLDDPGVHRPD